MSPTNGYLVVMLIWLAFEAALSLVIAARDTARRDVGGAAANTAMFTLRLLLVGLTVLQLGGCGGGECDDECRADFVSPPDCQARPELCI